MTIKQSCSAAKNTEKKPQKPETRAWVSRSLRALEAAKLVERCGDPNDSRLALFSLTERGRAVLDEFRPYAAWSEKVLLNGVDAAALKALPGGVVTYARAGKQYVAFTSEKPGRNAFRGSDLCL